jgi:hypothetical protein
VSEQVHVSPLPAWEENTERRLGIVEHKVDKLLDPETGIYPKMDAVQARLQQWAIALLTAIVVGAAVQLIFGGR